MKKNNLMPSVVLGVICLIAAFLQHLQIRKHQLSDNGFQVIYRINFTGDMNHITILKQSHHMGNCIHIANMTQKLVAQSLPLTGTAHQTGNIDKFKAGRHYTTGFFHIRQNLQTIIRHRYDPGIGFNRAKGEVCSFGAATAQSIEQSGFADVGQTDQTA
jgi:hypothetical protein